MSRRGASLVEAFAAVAFLVLAACGSGATADLTKGVPKGGARPTLAPVTTAVVQGPPPGPPAQPPCQLVPAADVARIVGNSVRPGTGDAKFCFWGTAVDGGTSADVTIEIPAQGRATQACAVQKLALPKEATQEEATGAGTSSVWSYQQNVLLVQATLIACFDNAVIRIGLTGERNQAQLKPIAVSLAQAAHAHV